MMGLTKRRTNRMIAALDPNFTYDESLRLRNENPDSLRKEVKKFVSGVSNTMEYRVEESDCNINGYDYLLFHYFDEEVYTHHDIPSEAPEFFAIGTTKMFALKTRYGFDRMIILVNWNPNEGIFQYSIATIVDNDFITVPTGTRLDYMWKYTDAEPINFADFMISYPSIVIDIVNDSDFGIENIMKYIKNHN